MFSVGILYSAQEFLAFVKDTPNQDIHLPEFMGAYSIASPQAVFEITQQCKWIRLNYAGYLEVTDRGMEILQAGQSELALRVQIGHIIETFIPPWLPLLSWGRLEIKKHLPEDALQCFSEAGLFSEPSDDIVIWWDRYSKVSRKVGKDSQLDIGRYGERLSLEYERKRTLVEPIWQGFETNLSGYDILSVISSTNLRPLLIEVKTSNSTPENANFYLTRNEWSVGAISQNYILHLWSLKPHPLLTIVSFTDLQSHIPIDRGNGQWEKSSVPFSSFIS